MTGLSDGDLIILTVVYAVAGYEVSRETYTWTLDIPTQAASIQHCQPSTNGAECAINTNPLAPPGTPYAKTEMENGGIATCYDQFAQVRSALLRRAALLLLSESGGHLSSPLAT